MTDLRRLVAEIGGVLYDNGRRALVPGPGHERSDRSVSLRVAEDGRLLIHCFSPKDDWRTVRDWLHARGWRSSGPSKSDARAYAPTVRDLSRKLRAARWWEESLSIGGTLGERYLRARSIEFALPPTLRFHPVMTSLEDRMRRPALVARIDDREARLQAIEVTLLTGDGRAKAHLATPRRVIGELKGGAVRLAAPDGELIVAEGLATALSAMESIGLPAWACLTAGNLARFEPPTPVRRLLIAVDQDESGQRAAAMLQDRLTPQIEVTLAPPPTFNDWNDWARRMRR